MVDKYTDSFTAEFVNDEPVIWKGLTLSELRMVLKYIGGGGATFSLTFMLALYPWFGVYGLFPAMLLVAYAFRLALIKIPQFKEGKPPNYIEHYIDEVFKKRSWRKVMNFSLGREKNPHG